jgi:hypothetical protein
MCVVGTTVLMVFGSACLVLVERATVTPCEANFSSPATELFLQQGRFAAPFETHSARHVSQHNMVCEGLLARSHTRMLGLFSPITRSPLCSSRDAISLGKGAALDGVEGDGLPGQAMTLKIKMAADAKDFKIEARYRYQQQ